MTISAFAKSAESTLDATTVVGRYARERMELGAPLSHRVSKPFFAASVGEAVDDALLETGYRLVSGAGEPIEQAQLLRMAMPLAHQNLKDVRVIDALVLLVGPAYRVVVDHVHRLIGLELRPAYRRYRTGQISSAKTNSAIGQWNCTTVEGTHSCTAKARS